MDVEQKIKRKIAIPDGSSLSKNDYRKFLIDSYNLIKEFSQYFMQTEDINNLELAHLIPQVSETVLAIYVGINDAVCNKSLVTPFLVRHGHNNVFVFDNNIFPGHTDVPSGTVDARSILKGFEPPNETWDIKWTYVMIEDTSRTFESLWREKGYIDMIPAKFEDFTLLTDSALSKVCTYISPKAFEHPVNANRHYLKAARNRGEWMADEFKVPELIKDEFDGLVPVVLNKGEKLYVATTDFGPCAHGWCNIHPDNRQYAVINENSAVPLDLVIAKPPANPRYAKGLIPAKGSADMTTDWFYRGQQIVRTPILQGLFKG